MAAPRDVGTRVRGTRSTPGTQVRPSQSSAGDAGGGAGLVFARPESLPATTHSYLARAAESLSEAVGSTDVAARYASAHVAALRAAAALLSARARPAPVRGRRQKNAWVLLAEVAPELGEWATFFAAGAGKRAAAEAGSSRAVGEREADDLVRDADRFLAVVEELLGLVPHAAVPPSWAACQTSPARRAG